VSDVTEVLASAAPEDDDVEVAYQRGNQAYLAGDHAAARTAYQDAIARLLPDDPRTVDLYENLGIACWQLGRWRPAIRAFLRVLDGDLGGREQSLRLLVSCLFHDGLALDGERLLAAYEERHGRHPQGWSPG
jgi:tetratricopeptide (TPR) repeat protein